jgi:hypothetical protein
MELLSGAPEKDKELWRQAKKRAGFKTSFFTYIIVNAFLWALWWIGSRDEGYDSIWEVWPIWPTLGWGIGIAFQYWDAYKDPKGGLVEREYQKLKREKGM